MGSGHILDTNTVIYYLEGVLRSSGKMIVEQAILKGARISIISKIELLSWNPPGGANVVTSKLLTRHNRIWLDEVVVDHTIHLRKNYRKNELPDAIIAATALCYNLDLITRNIFDFSSIKGLKTTTPLKINVRN